MNPRITVYETVQSLPDTVWRQLDLDCSILFQGERFLAVQENCLRRRGLRFHYVVAWEDKRVCALFIFQEYSLSFSDIFPSMQWCKRFALKGFAGKVLTRCLAVIQKLIPVRALIRAPLINIVVCGDVVSTGISGVLFANDPPLDGLQRGKLLQYAAEVVRRRRRRGFGLLLLKDLNYDLHASETVPAAGYSALRLPPTMVLAIPHHWRTLDDYLHALKSKYRTVVKQTRKAAAPLLRRPLSLDDMLQYQAQINALYAAVHARAKAKGPYLGSEYFIALRRALSEDRYFVEGYFYGDQLLAFNTRYMVNGVVESTFFGVTPQDNEKYQLLKCMLVDDLEFAIENRAQFLHLGRTNYDMKSALGAQVVECFSCYRPLNWYSAGLGVMLKSLTNAEPWVARHPYRLSETPAVMQTCFASLERDKGLLG